MRTKLSFLALLIGISGAFASSRTKTSATDLANFRSANVTEIFTDITLPFTETDSFTVADSIRYPQVYDGDYNAKMYKFTLANDTSITIKMSSDTISDFYFSLSSTYDFINGIENGGDSIRYTNLAAGTYYLYLDIDNDFGAYTMSIYESELADTLAFTAINLPYFKDSITFGPTDQFFYDGEEYLKGYTFTLNNDTTVYFYGQNELIGISPTLYISESPFTNTANADASTSIPADGLSLNLPAGTYYIAIGDNGLYSMSGQTYYYSSYISISTDSVKPTVAMPMATNNKESRKNSFKAYGTDGTIIVEGATGNKLIVFDICGLQLINTKCTSSRQEFAVQKAGIYIVNVNGVSSKVLVK